MDILETMTDFFTKASLEEARKNCSPMQDSFDQCLDKLDKKGFNIHTHNAEELMRPCQIFRDLTLKCLKKHIKRK